MNYLTHTVGANDTLEIIAYGQLGTTDISGIIKLNNLRYPYISDNPIDQYAHAKGNLQITGSLAAGISSYTFGNTNSIAVTVLDTIYVEDWATGKYEAVVVKSVSYNSTTGAVTAQFQTPLVNTYSAAAVVTAFPNQENVITKVARTGDLILLPIEVVTATSTQQSDPYGTDIQLDGSGFIVRTAKGWATVSGIQNVQQAVMMRWNTPQGTLQDDDTYGNRIFQLLGELNEPFFINLAQTFAEAAAKADPRVGDVQRITVTPGDSPDQLYITADISPGNSLQPFNVSSALTFM